MRADGILKVILNVPLNKSTEVMTGMKSSLASEKFVRITALKMESHFNILFEPEALLLRNSYSIR